jgi:hypothetical protein
VAVDTVRDVDAAVPEALAYDLDLDASRQHQLHDPGALGGLGWPEHRGAVLPGVEELPAYHELAELIGAGMLILAGGGRGLPMDYDELNRWPRIEFERGTR